MLELKDLTKLDHKRGVELQKSEDEAVLLIMETNLLTKEVEFHVIDTVGAITFGTLEEAIEKYNKLAF